MAQQIAEITKVPTNAQVIKILNEVIKRYNSLGDLYQYKGSVQTYDDLLAIQNPQIGDVYNVIQEDAEEGIAAGSNFAWNGTVWDNLGGSLAGVVQSVNGINPDSLGNVLLPLIKNITTNQGVLTITRNDNSTEQFNNIKKLYMLSLGENINLNDLTESGIYICVSNAYAANYENCPIQKAFLLEVQATVNGNFVYQFLTQYNDGTSDASQQYVRTYYNNNWSVWRMAGSGSNLTTYTSLEQLGIMPGQETFASIHFALPVNSVLEYYVSEAQNFADIYPASYGNFIATRLAEDITIFYFTGTNQTIYVTHYHVTNNTNPSWTQIAKQSDLTNLSNSVVKSVNGIKPTNGNVTIDIPEPVIASEAEAEAGTNNTKFMTPLRVAQALAANNGGIVSANLAQNGYVKFANGFILQWGVIPSGYYAYTAATVNLPMSFRNTNYVVIIMPFGTTGSGDTPYRQFVCVNKNTNKFTTANNSSSSVSAMYFAAG